LEIAAQIDDDPFLDFSYGFITGKTPAAAVRLAEAGLRTERKRQSPTIAVAGVAGGELLYR
jgi:hypothetical protein